MQVFCDLCKCFVFCASVFYLFKCFVICASVFYLCKCFVICASVFYLCKCFDPKSHGIKSLITGQEKYECYFRLPVKNTIFETTSSQTS